MGAKDNTLIQTPRGLESLDWQNHDATGMKPPRQQRHDPLDRFRAVSVLMFVTPDTASSNRSRDVLALIGAATLARVIFAATTGLGIDETYMVAIGRHWDIGYFDHPPLAWWLSHGASLLAGHESGLIVRAPFIALAALSTWLMYRLGAWLAGETAGLIAAIALTCAPVLGVTTGTWVLPDGPLDAALLAATLCLGRVLLTPGASPALWLAAGLFGGLAMLSKFHGAFVFAGAGLFMLTSAAHRRWLVSPWPWLGMIVALVVASPTLIWNIQHDWATFAFQGSRAATRVFRPWMPLVALAGQAAFLAPWIWAPLMIATIKTARRFTADPKRWLLFCLGVGPVALFALVTAWSDQRPYFHWAAPGYLLLLPLLGRMLAPAWDAGSRSVRLWLRGSIAFDALAVAALIALSLFPGIVGVLPGAAATKDPLAEMADWTDAATYALAHASSANARPFIVARRWYEAAKIDYALHGAGDVICIGDDCRGYNFVKPARDPTGADAIVMIPENAPIALEPIARQFATIEPLSTLDIAHGPLIIARLRTYRAMDYRPARR